MTTVFLLADNSDPVGNAAESLLNKSVSVRRISLEEISEIEFDSSNVLLIDNEMADSLAADALPISGLIQFLGCSPSSGLLNHSASSDTVIAGISPSIAPRVANRVIGFTGPLNVKVKPTWGIVGLGEVGCEVVRKVTATGNSAAIADVRTPRSGILDELGVRRKSLDLLLSGSDVISVHVHQGPTATPLIAEREINLMNSDAVLINTSHTSVVDEAAVISALENGGLAGYATDCPGDVTAEADQSLADLGKLIVTTNPLTNQIGAAQQIAKFIAENIDSYATGSPVRGIFQPVDFPTAGDPSFWSSRMSPRQD
jgi:hypothetical protein